MRQVAAFALLATGRALVLPANAPRTKTVRKADMLDAPLDLVLSNQAQLIGQYLDDVVAEPLDLVRDHHAYMWEEFADQARTPLDLVSDHHAYLWQEFIDEQRTPLDLVSSRPVWKSTSVSGVTAMTRPSWLGRAVKNRQRHAIEQA